LALAKRRTYSDKFKAGAILMLETKGYPTNEYALSEVGKHLGVHPRTLRRWVTGGIGAPPDSLVIEQKKGFTDLIDDEIREAFKTMAAARPDASYRDLVIGAATLFDKLQLLQGNPTERIESTLTVHDSREQLARLIDRHATRLGAPRDPGLPH
jgi:hypothetical protein